jgi:predicted enzyme related to lactoylglutathione lyase
MRFEITLDCPDPASLSDFWAAAVHAARVEVGPRYATVYPPDGVGLCPIVLQRVPEPKQGKSRVHLDLYVDDFLAEADRLVALGATRIGPSITEQGETWVVLADPAGNEFCVCR